LTLLVTKRFVLCKQLEHVRTQKTVDHVDCAYVYGICVCEAVIMPDSQRNF